MPDPVNTEVSPDLAALLAILDLRQVGDDVFVGVHPEKVGPRTFGGQLLAQSVVAAARTLTKGTPPVHALHAHLIRGGDVNADLEYRVTRLRDGRPFANRQVTAVQNDEVIYTALIAFQQPSAGLEHGVDLPDVPGPDALEPVDVHFTGFEDEIPMFIDALRPIHMRFANDPSWKLREAGTTLGHNRVWMRTDGPLPDDTTMHVAAMCYASDSTVLDSILTTHGLSWGADRLFVATVNHSMWFHRPVRFDDWLLYATESPVAVAGRGLSSGRFFDAEGSLIATVTQEAIIKHMVSRAAR
ncbi:acyl-CoA thioesterase II [Gordonia jinhuaensis]|uniref:Acyl-CoA thioesterase II n=1 Tax=Gordonia jinhuaensis TaxID=1517702 RepID=A0A916SVG5_9ACTN|nr:acyl-CoA thioesterase II [Gordonia jinhuaensis]